MVDRLTTLLSRRNCQLQILLQALLPHILRKALWSQRHFNALLLAIIRVATGINNSFYRHRFIIALVMHDELSM